MKKWNPVLLSLMLFVAITACDPDDGPGTKTPDPITPDLTVKVNTSVAGYVIDENGDPVVFAEVKAGDKQVLTDVYGYFSIPNTSLAAIAGQVNVTKTGYFDGYRTFLPVKDKETFLRIQLLTKSESGTVSAAAGGAVTTTDGAKVTLAANGVVKAGDGAAYTGEVRVSARLISASEEDDLQLDNPGDLRGTDSDGHLNALKSYATVAVELAASNGQLLQLAAGKPATISLPIPAALRSEAPATIALWYFNTSTGLWQEEGTATKTGNAYVGTVTHFSFWAGAEGVPLVDFTARVVDGSSQPLGHVAVNITVAGMPKNAGYGRFAYTDADGYVTGAVFANADLVLDILTPCALPAYSHEFSTGSTAVNLGTLTGNLGQSVVTLSGTVKDCENQPLASGYVQTYDNGFYNRIPVTNGNFSFTGVMCTNATVNVVVVDNATYQQSTPRSVELSAGANNLGVLSACGISTMGSITYTFDEQPIVHILEPTDTIGAYLLDPVSTGTWTQIVTLSGDQSQGTKMAFQFSGGTTIGSEHKILEVFSDAFPSGRGFWPDPPGVKLTITEYGEVGGFVSGSFTSKMLDFGDNSLHDFTCEFRVRRYH